MRRQVEEIGLTLLIVSYLVQAIASLSPESTLKKVITEPVDNWWQFFGLNQSWSLFSPIIRTINYHTLVKITFEDDSEMLWQIPRMDRLDLLTRFRLEKFRKWGVDSLPWADYKQLWPDFARATGRMFYSPTNKPKKLSLILEWTDIPKPEGFLIDRNRLPLHNKPSTVFVYFYKPEDFK